MPITRANGVRLFYETTESAGPPLVLVHGSWVDHHTWDAVVPHVSRYARVCRYDRRGHGQSERVERQGSIDEDVEDLAALIRQHGTPAYVAGNSFGGIIVLRLAAAYPELLAGISVHEPPLLEMVAEDPAVVETGRRIGPVVELLLAGRSEDGAREFVNSVALGAGEWEKLPRIAQETFISNAPTFLDEVSEPGGAYSVDRDRLGKFDGPVLLTKGGRSPSFYGVIIDELRSILPAAGLHVFPEAGHIPQMSHPEEFSEILSRLTLYAPA